MGKKVQPVFKQREEVGREKKGALIIMSEGSCLMTHGMEVNKTRDFGVKLELFCSNYYHTGLSSKILQTSYMPTILKCISDA